MGSYAMANRLNVTRTFNIQQEAKQGQTNIVRDDRIPHQTNKIYKWLNVANYSNFPIWIYETQNTNATEPILIIPPVSMLSFEIPDTTIDQLRYVFTMPIENPNYSFITNGTKYTAQVIYSLNSLNWNYASGIQSVTETNMNYYQDTKMQEYITNQNIQISKLLEQIANQNTQIQKQNDVIVQQKEQITQGEQNNINNQSGIMYNIEITRQLIAEYENVNLVGFHAIENTADEVIAHWTPEQFNDFLRWYIFDQALVDEKIQFTYMQTMRFENIYDLIDDPQAGGASDCFIEFYTPSRLVPSKTYLDYLDVYTLSDKFIWTYENRGIESYADVYNYCPMGLNIDITYLEGQGDIATDTSLIRIRGIAYTNFIIENPMDEGEIENE